MFSSKTKTKMFHVFYYNYLKLKQQRETKKNLERLQLKLKNIDEPSYDFN